MRSHGRVRLGGTAPGTAQAAGKGRHKVDTQRIRDSLAAVAQAGMAGELVEVFYARLFRDGGERVQRMFPPGMSAQRDKLLAAVLSIVSRLDDPDQLGGYVTGLVPFHRMAGVTAADFDLVGAGLLGALAEVAGDGWDAETDAAWAEAYAALAKLMTAAMDESGLPAWWDATIMHAERPAPDVVVFSARLAAPMTWLPGQSVRAEWSGAPRIRRALSPVNLPGDGRTMTFHVRAVPGGLFSTGLAARAAAGDTLRLSAPAGGLTLDESSPRDVLMLAEDAGLAPLRAILAQLAARDAPPRVALFAAAARPDGLHDLPALEALAARSPWLTVTAAAGPGAAISLAGIDPAAGGDWTGRDAYVVGTAPMVEAAAGRLIGAGMPPGQVHVEQWGAP